MAVDINQVRQKYPEYSDLSDTELLQGLHSKFYSDIPFNEFASNISLTTPAVTVTEKAPTEAEKAAFEAEQAGLGERMFGMGSPTYSFLRGAVIEPALGVNQLLAQTGMFGERVAKGASDVVKQEAEAAKTARETAGREGVDWLSMAGAVLSPVNKAFTMATAPTALQRVGQAAASGGLYGAIQPVVGDDFLAEKYFQVGLGATLGGALGGVMEGITAGLPQLTKLIKELPITAKNKEDAFKRYVQELIPDDKKALMQELRQSGEIISGSSPTVAEAISDMPSAYKILKAQERLEKGQATAGKFIERRGQQEAARVRTLDQVFGSPADLELAKNARLTSTLPMRERALKEADFYGETASKLEQQLAKGTQQFGVLLPKQKADIIKGQIENIKANGYYPLTSKSLIDKIDVMSNSPGLRSNEMLTYAIAKLRGKLDKLTDERGVINSADMYNVRKEIAQDLAEYVGSKNLNDKSFRAQATGAETSLKKLIDVEINKAAGSTLWTNYLNKFAEYSRKIDQLELGQGLKQKLSGKFSEETAGKFLQAITEAPTTIKKATGQSRYTTLEEVLTPSQTSAVNKVYADLVRQEKALVSGKGIEKAKPAEIAQAQEIPGFISSTITFVKNILRDLAKVSQKDFDRQMADLLLNPQKFADFLETIPKQNQDEVFKAMSAKMSPDIRSQFAQMYATRPTVQETSRATAQQMTQ